MTKAEQTAQSLLNKRIVYGGKIITITGYELSEDGHRIRIHTNIKQGHLDYTIHDAPYALKNLILSKETEVAVTAPTESEKLMQQADSADELKRILMDSIKKVQADPEYIKQATVINNNVNTMVNITKLQLEYAKAVEKMKIK